MGIEFSNEVFLCLSSFPLSVKSLCYKDLRDMGVSSIHCFQPVLMLPFAQCLQTNDPQNRMNASIAATASFCMDGKTWL